MPCPPGLACPDLGMDLTKAKAKLCKAGFYCLSGAKTDEPTILSDGGNICPAGHYCPSPDPETTSQAFPTGTQVPHPCPPGTYRADTGGSDLTTHCLACPEGYYCQDYGSTNYVICDEGWYCGTKEVSPTPEGKYCPKGHFCTQGKKSPCPFNDGTSAGGDGKYQDKIGQDSCITCPAGYQCPYADPVAKTPSESKKVCGNNRYCPNGYNLAVNCPAGTYTTKKTATASTDCLDCPSGYICQCTTASASTDTCIVEFIKCPAGKWCPDKTSSSDGA